MVKSSIILTIEREMIQTWKKCIEESIVNLSEKKTYLENDLYYKDIDQFCNKDDKNTKEARELDHKVSLLKRDSVLKAARCFDVFDSLYPAYSIGKSEFQIERVSLLQRKNCTTRGLMGNHNIIDFVMVDRNNQQALVAHIPAFAGLAVNDDDAMF